MSKGKVKNITRVVLVLAVMMFFAWLAEQNLTLSGKKVVTYYFNDQPHAIVGFWPGQTGSTRYFDIKTSVLFRHATFELTGDNIESRVGVRVPPDVWSYRQVSLNEEGRAKIDLGGATRTNGKYTFGLFFNENDQVSKPVKMTIILERDRISFSKIIEKISRLWGK